MSKKLISASICFILFFQMTVLGIFTENAYAAYENDQFIKAARSFASPGKDVLRVNQYQDVVYTFNGDEFDIGDVPDQKPKEISIVIDCSYSMGYTTGTGQPDLTRLDSLKTAAKQFIDLLAKKNIRINVVTFASDANRDGKHSGKPYDSVSRFYSMNESSDVDSIKSHIDNIEKRNNTNIGDGMRRAYHELRKLTTDSKKYMVLMTDGRPTKYSKQTNSSSSSFKTSDGDAKYIDGNGETDPDGMNTVS